MIFNYPRKGEIKHSRYLFGRRLESAVWKDPFIWEKIDRLINSNIHPHKVAGLQRWSKNPWHFLSREGRTSSHLKGGKDQARLWMFYWTMLEDVELCSQSPRERKYDPNIFFFYLATIFKYKGNPQIFLNYRECRDYSFNESFLKKLL